MKEKETTNAMSCPTKSPEASARRKMILSGVVMLVLMAAITILMIPVMRLMMQEGGKEQLIAKIQSYGIFATAAVCPDAGDSNRRRLYSGRANPDDWRSGVRHGAGDSAQLSRVISGNGNCLLSGAVDWTAAFESLCKRGAPRTVFLFKEPAEDGTDCVSIIFVSGFAERCPDLHCRL